jgi:hypothetical protein
MCLVELCILLLGFTQPGSSGSRRLIDTQQSDQQQDLNYINQLPMSLVSLCLELLGVQLKSAVPISLMSWDLVLELLEILLKNQLLIS